MKKLLVLAAVVAMASASQAASYIWGFQSGEIEGPTAAYSDADGFLTGGTAYLYIAGSLVATATQDAEAFNFGAFDAGNPVSSDAVSSTAGQAYTLVLRTSDDAYEITYSGTSTSYEVVGMGTSTTIMNLVDTTPYTAGSWTAVPEPTSGLLLLLGVAGLALKRKRA